MLTWKELEVIALCSTLSLIYIQFLAGPVGQQWVCSRALFMSQFGCLNEKHAKIPVILIKTTNNLLGLKNMIGLVQQINKISHSKGNFAHRQFLCLRPPAHIFLSIMLVNEGEWGGWPWYFFDHINNNRDTGHPSWPDHLSCLHVLEWVQQVVAIFHFHLLTTWPCAFPGSGGWALIHGRHLVCTHLQALLRCTGCIYTVPQRSMERWRKAVN